MTNPDYRAMCAELVKDFDDLRESSEGVAGFHRNGDLAPWEELSVSGRYPWLSSFDRARALLAEEDGPAVPDGREPASVATQPSDGEVEKPAAWMCPAEPYWDGKEWRPRWQVTTDQELAEYWARPDKPTPLFTNALPTPEAQPVPEAVGPSADEWDALVKRAWDEYETVGYQGERFVYDSDFCNALDFVRRELARWGRPAAAPVPVSERLPGPEDCDAEGRCWLGGHQMGRGTGTWLLGYPAWAERFPDVHQFWLPANALPLPAPEVQL